MPLLKAIRARTGAVVALHNLGWLIGEKAARLLCSLGVGLLLARHLGPSRLGLLGFASAVVALVGSVASLGLEPLLKREILQKPGGVRPALAASVLLRLGTGLFCYIAIIFGCGMGLVAPGAEARLVLILGLTLFQPALMVSDIYVQAQLKAKVSVIIQLAVLIVSSLLRVYCIRAEARLEVFAAISAGESLIAGSLIWAAARRLGCGYSWKEVAAGEMHRLLKLSWPLLIAGMAVTIYLEIDEVMLRAMVGPEAVGIYTAATRISEVWYFLPVAVASSVLPALLRAKSAGEAAYRTRLQIYYDASALCAYALAFPISLLSPWLIRVAFGSPYAAAGPILAVHIWSSVFVFVGVARSQWLVNEGLQMFSLGATLAGAGCNIMLNCLFIPRWSGLGAAYATVVSYAVAAWIASYFHPRARTTAGMQTRALLLPIFGWRYLRLSR